jgi:integrase/recombinase XerC
LCEKNPFGEVSAPKLDKTLPKFLYSEEMEILFESINTQTLLGIRDNALLEFMYGTGVRVSELCSIKEKDIDYINKQVIVLGKGKKERYLPLHDLVIESLQEYVSFARNELQLKNKKEVSDILFLNNHGGPLTPRGVRDILNRLVTKASETYKISPHMIRHTFPTHLLNNGADLITVQELLGHANLSTTQIYTHISKEQLKREYMDKFPRARRENTENNK